MLPLLRKFKVTCRIATRIVETGGPTATDWNDEGSEIAWEGGEPTVWMDYHLQPDGKILRVFTDEVRIKQIRIEDFLRPREIIDNFLKSIQEGVNYRKEQFTQIEMAKTIIDVITKGVPKTKSKRKVK